MWQQLSCHGRRALMLTLAVATTVTAVVVVGPVRATAQQFLNTNLVIARVSLPASAESLTANIRIRNDGPSSLPMGAYAVRVKWGFFVRRASTSSQCETIDAWSCQFEGRAVEYIDRGPLPGPRFVDYSVTLVGTPPPGERRFVGIEIIQLDYFDLRLPDRTELSYQRP